MFPVGLAVLDGNKEYNVAPSMRFDIGLRILWSRRGGSALANRGKFVVTIINAALATYAVSALILCGWAQEGMSGSRQQSGIAAGSAHAPVLDPKHRPITAGGFVDGAPVVFREKSASASAVCAKAN